MKRTAMVAKELVEVQKWKVGDSVVARDTDFNITQNKVYKVLARGKFYDCLVIVNDLGKEEEYSQEYFELVLE